MVTCSASESEATAGSTWQPSAPRTGWLAQPLKMSGTRSCSAGPAPALAVGQHAVIAVRRHAVNAVRLHAVIQREHTFEWFPCCSQRTCFAGNLSCPCCTYCRVVILKGKLLRHSVVGRGVPVCKVASPAVAGCRKGVIPRASSFSHCRAGRGNIIWQAASPAAAVCKHGVISRSIFE